MSCREPGFYLEKIGEKEKGNVGGIHMYIYILFQEVKTLLYKREKANFLLKLIN